MAHPDDDRRAADRWIRDKVSERLVAIETSQKLYHDEIKGITEGLHKDINRMSEDVKTLNRVVFGGEAPGILENMRGLMWKFGIATTVGFGAIMFVLKLFTPSLTKVAEKIAGTDPIAQFKYQSGKKMLKHYNPQTGKNEYFIEFKPVGIDNP